MFIQDYIAMTKVDAPRMCLKIIDEAIQIHGAHGVSQDSKLSDLYHHVHAMISPCREPYIII